MIRLFPRTFTRCAELPAPPAGSADFCPVPARYGLALRFCAAAVVGAAVVVRSIVVWAVAALALPVIGDVSPRRSVERYRWPGNRT
jgi:hypothetical protein